MRHRGLVVWVVVILGPSALVIFKVCRMRNLRSTMDLIRWQSIGELAQPECNLWKFQTWKRRKTCWVKRETCWPSSFFSLAAKGLGAALSVCRMSLKELGNVGTETYSCTSLWCSEFSCSCWMIGVLCSDLLNCHVPVCKLPCSGCQRWVHHDTLERRNTGRNVVYVCVTELQWMQTTARNGWKWRKNLIGVFKENNLFSLKIILKENASASFLQMAQRSR